MLERIAQRTKNSALVLLTAATLASSSCGTNSTQFIPAATPLERMRQACPTINNDNILQALIYEIQGLKQQGLTRDQSFQYEYQSCVSGAGAQGSNPGVQYICQTCMTQGVREVYGQ